MVIIGYENSNINKMLSITFFCFLLLTIDDFFDILNVALFAKTMCYKKKKPPLLKKRA
jgi:hypothetical protein